MQLPLRWYKPRRGIRPVIVTAKLPTLRWYGLGTRPVQIAVKASVAHASAAGASVVVHNLDAPILERLIGLLTREDISPRHRETLACLLVGDSEKQIAHKLCISQHTVHVYVKSLYRVFGVESRGELLARFIPPEVLIASQMARRPVRLQPTMPKLAKPFRPRDHTRRPTAAFRPK